MRTCCRALEADALRLSRQTSAVVREALATLPLEDRMLLRFRFASSMKRIAVAMSPAPSEFSVQYG